MLSDLMMVVGGRGQIRGGREVVGFAQVAQLVAQGMLVPPTSP